MKGYIVEIDPEIESSLTAVMPGVKWTNWKPVFLPDTDSLVEQVQASVEVFLSTFKEDKISSRSAHTDTMGKGHDEVRRAPHHRGERVQGQFLHGSVVGLQQPGTEKIERSTED